MLTMQKVRTGYQLILVDDNIIGEVEYKKQSRWHGTLRLDGITLHRHARTARDTLEMLKTAHYWHLKGKHSEALPSGCTV
jgi:hypothetical protein